MVRTPRIGMVVQAFPGFLRLTPQDRLFDAPSVSRFAGFLVLAQDDKCQRPRLPNPSAPITRSRRLPDHPIPHDPAYRIGKHSLGCWTTEKPYMPLAVEVAGKTDVGSVRANNEDNFGYDARYGIFVVCDGMGGQAAGEVASKIGVDTVLNYFRTAGGRGSLPLAKNAVDGLSPLGQALLDAISQANRAIYATRQKKKTPP